MNGPDSPYSENSTAPTRERRGGKAMLNPKRSLYGDMPSTARLPDTWRNRLPDPPVYYRQQVAKLGSANGNGYAVGLCPFHDDHSPSFSVKLTDPRGHWCCHAGCGQGDMVSFHQRRTGLDFRTAVRELIGSGR